MTTPKNPHRPLPPATHRARGRVGAAILSLTLVGALSSAPSVATATGTNAPGAPSDPATATVGKAGVTIITTKIGDPPAISDSGLRIAAAVKSDDGFEKLPKEVQAYLSAPVSQTDVEITVQIVDNETGLASSSGSGHVGTGCWNTIVKRSSSNIFGAVLYRAETTALNWCNNGSVLTNTPGHYRYTNSYWGWSQCGWFNTYDSFLSGNFRWGVGGVARFALANSCFSPQAQLTNEIQVQGNGYWYTWTN